MTFRASAYAIVRPLLPAAARDAIELRFSNLSALKNFGWPMSRKLGLPVDSAGRPLPWFTYAAIKLLENRIPPGLNIFEYGMGNSTLWWSQRARRVESCEHDSAWFERFQPIVPRNVIASLHPVTSDDYVLAASKCVEEIDVLIIDGRRRVACARASMARLSTRAVIIWDNADRLHYQAGLQELTAHGFDKRIDLWGMAPIDVCESCTSILYRGENCLNL